MLCPAGCAAAYHYGQLYDSLGARSRGLSNDMDFRPPGKPGDVIHFVCGLVTGYLNFVSVDNNHVVTRVHMQGVLHFACRVIAWQWRSPFDQASGLRRQ